MDYIIRPYKLSDLADLMVTWEQANQLAHPFLAQQYIDQVKQDIPAIYLPNADTWVAEVNNTVIGFIALIGAQVGALFVLPEHHGKKVGKALMDKAQFLHGDLTVEVFKDNSIGNHFYNRYGFTLSEEQLHDPTGEKVLLLAYSGK